MSKKARYLLGILVTILLGTWLYAVFCCSVVKIGSVSIEDISTSQKDNGMTTTFESNTGFSFTSPDLSFKCADNFDFLSSNFNFLMPVSDSINFGILKLKEVLEKTPSIIKITGFYTSKEVNNSIFPNVGLARANSVKNYLVEKGIAEKYIEIFDAQKENLTSKNDTLLGFVGFNWSKVDATVNADKNWDASKKSINAKPLTLYFKTGQSSIDLTQQQKQKIADIVAYLNHVEGSKISITGHSDNQPGVRNTNQYYAEERAKFAKKYFVANGISENKIEVSGKGESQPIADNATEEGKAKNRRAEVTIK